MATLTIKPISEIRDALTKLVQQPRENKVASKLRAVSLLAEDVRALARQGYTYTEIADILSEHGLPISAPTLRSYMSRINATKPEQRQPVARSAQSPLATTLTTKSTSTSPSHARSTIERPSISSGRFRPTPDSDDI
ncbi:hypothetical protein [Rugamonas apoptosis]|uniref:Mobilization protein MobC n=1 Tax=Rugamonas apoptosis TaxID=2758570 RepID=A0A7W2IJF2_9BURK|nr:hypothetical protein [Rugamonas apoptosis]MBA5686700.1 hypothetical protein [Rugamonas apoptosis]